MTKVVACQSSDLHYTSDTWGFRNIPTEVDEENEQCENAIVWRIQNA